MRSAGGLPARVAPRPAPRWRRCTARRAPAAHLLLPQATPAGPAPHPPPRPARSSIVRPFRYAATVTAVQLVSSWNRVQLALTQARETAQFQLAAEEKKGGKVRRGLGLGWGWGWGWRWAEV